MYMRVFNDFNDLTSKKSFFFQDLKMWYWFVYLLLIQSEFLFHNWTIERQFFILWNFKKNINLEMKWYGVYNHSVQKYIHRSETKNIVWNTESLFQAFAFSRHWKHEKIVSTFWISACVSLTTAKIFPGWRGQRIY